jgi:hypothetical protein
MELKQPNDIFVATLNSPNASVYDLISNNIKADNTSFLSKEQYKATKYVQEQFKLPNGGFDDVTFDKAYKLAQEKYVQLTNEAYLDNLDQMEYSPFDVTRPKNAKVTNVSTFYTIEPNPFKELKGWFGYGSVDQNPLSLRELAQQSKVYDPQTNTWSEESLNDMSIFKKFLGETLVYAQFDEDGEHLDPVSNVVVKHKKGDWKVNADGAIFTEKLGNREIYGKQVVNPADVMTTDGSLWNSFDFFDADEREKSLTGTTVKLAAQIIPYVIPGVNLWYGGITAAISLAAVMPTFYKSLEGMLLGEKQSSLNRAATAAEGYLSKYVQTSTSDEAQGSMFNYEQLGGMVAAVFGQIYQQRAAASLSLLMNRPKNLEINKRIAQLTDEINDEFVKQAFANSGKLTKESLTAVHANIMSKIPGLKELQERQSQMAKTFSLAYMALTTTGDIYGEALNSGYDRRTAGMAALAAAAGQYGLMMNNRMGDWFLDKTTGYSLGSNKAMMRKAVDEYLKPIKKAFEHKSLGETKTQLAGIFSRMKTSIHDLFTNPTVLGEELFKHSLIEGVEEVSEQAVLDATKGIVDVMGYLGLTAKEGSFGGFSNVFSAKGAENYLASLVGGLLGGPMFELNNTWLEPRIKKALGKNVVMPELRKRISQYVANGESEELIAEFNRQRSRLGNTSITVPTAEGDVASTADGKVYSQADVVVDNAVQFIKNISEILHTDGLAVSNAEIVRKALVDGILLQELDKARGDSKIGIEGLVLSDFTETLDKYVNLNLQIKGLSTTPEAKTQNKESIDRILEEAKIYKTRLDDILEGKLAQEYFDQAEFYLRQAISGKYMHIDRETFSMNKYGKSFYSLPKDGVGITQERVNNE